MVLICRRHVSWLVSRQRLVCQLSWLFTTVSPGPNEVNIYWVEDKLKIPLEAETKTRWTYAVSHHPRKGKEKKTNKDILPLSCSSCQRIHDAALTKHPHQLRHMQSEARKGKKLSKLVSMKKQHARPQTTKNFTKENFFKPQTNKN